MFLDRFLSQELQEARARQFDELVQGTMIVEHYAATFVELSRFASYLIPDEVKKVAKFERGLHLRIRSRLIPLRIRNFIDLVTRATLVEEDMKANAELFNQKKCQPPLLVPNKNKKPTPSNRPRPSQDNQSNPVYKICKKMHLGNCLLGHNACFMCREPNYMAQDCQKKNTLAPAKGSGQRATTPPKCGY
ncbi:hypothetical protein F2P56_012903, partial [Juglans regia]